MWLTGESFRYVSFKESPVVSRGFPTVYPSDTAHRSQMDQAGRSSLNGGGGVVGYQLEEWNVDSGCIKSTMGRRRVPGRTGGNGRKQLPLGNIKARGDV